DRIEVIRADVFRAFERLSERQFDLIFVDPPYHMGLAQRAVELVIEKNLLASDGLMIVEIGANEKITSALDRLRREDYGRTTAIEIFGRIT
ncbi:MAG: RsmD family RNA methyltransferase, partial [Selenomonadaceae bacterium]|nr:RsmD family RNA methyltransferase [Selenomonadaceae bacterium]